MTMTFWGFPWPDARVYCVFIGMIFTVYFVKALVEAIQHSTKVHNDGTVGWAALAP